MNVPKIELPIEFEGIIATSLPMQAVVRRILEAAAVDIPVLNLGVLAQARTLLPLRSTKGVRDRTNLT